MDSIMCHHFKISYKYFCNGLAVVSFELYSQVLNCLLEYSLRKLIQNHLDILIGFCYDIFQDFCCEFVHTHTATHTQYTRWSKQFFGIQSDSHSDNHYGHQQQGKPHLRFQSSPKLNHCIRGMRSNPKSGPISFIYISYII